jgi:hypothetical protein
LSAWQENSSSYWASWAWWQEQAASSWAWWQEQAASWAWWQEQASSSLEEKEQASSSMSSADGREQAKVSKMISQFKPPVHLAAYSHVLAGTGGAAMLLTDGCSSEVIAVSFGAAACNGWVIAARWDSKH